METTPLAAVRGLAESLGIPKLVRRVLPSSAMGLADSLVSAVRMNGAQTTTAP